MKNTLIFFLVGFSLTGFAFANAANAAVASQPEEYQLPVYKVPAISKMPVIIRQTHPQVPTGLIGKTFNMKFSVNERGFPKDIRSVDSLQRLGMTDERLADFAVQMTQILNRWKFNPALDANGNPIKVKLLMPVKIVRGTSGSQTEVVLLLDEAAYERG